MEGAIKLSEKLTIPISQFMCEMDKLTNLTYDFIGDEFTIYYKNNGLVIDTDSIINHSLKNYLDSNSFTSREHNILKRDIYKLLTELNKVGIK